MGIDVAGDACASPGYFDLNVRVDRTSGFALQDDPTVQPDPVTAPRISGRLRAGARVSCRTGRWRGGPASLTVRWQRLGHGPRRVVGRRRSHRVSRRDAAAGLTCAVTAHSRGGRVTAKSRPLEPRPR